MLTLEYGPLFDRKFKMHVTTQKVYNLGTLDNVPFKTSAYLDSYIINGSVKSVKIYYFAEFLQL